MGGKQHASQVSDLTFPLLLPLSFPLCLPLSEFSGSMESLFQNHLVDSIGPFLGLDKMKIEEAQSGDRS